MEIKQQIERMNAIAADARARGDGKGPTEAEFSEIFDIGLGLVGGLLADMNRIANAAESMAESLRSIDNVHGVS